MKLSVTHQEKYSRGQLLLRTFFGWLYIGIPHVFLLFFVGIRSAILSTGRSPVRRHVFNVGTYRRVTRINLYPGNFTDLHPAFSGKE